MPSISEEEMEAYRATCRRRDAAAQRRQKQAQQRARRAARQAADLLCKEFEVERVVLFGSVAREAFLGPRSDVDLAIEGLAARHFADAVDRVQAVAPRGGIDLVRLEQCSASLAETIQTDGIELHSPNSGNGRERK